jgi:hypothetical protein
MKTIITSLIIILASLSAIAQNTYYINSNHPNASDANLGTDPSAPWATLNESKWGSTLPEGSIINIAAGTYTYGAGSGLNITSNNITVIGSGKTEVILQGVDDATFNAKSGSNVKLAKIAGLTPTFNTVTFKKMTLRNSIMPSAVYEGGFFEILAGNSLLLEDMIIERTYFPSKVGGAIRSKGNLTCTDVTIQNCQAYQGGAVFTDNAGSYNFTRCQFKNNTAIQGTASAVFGGAIYFTASNGTLTALNTVSATFDNCLFENNKSDRLTTGGAGSPQGGAITVRAQGYNILNIAIKNSAFINNYAYSLSGAISTDVTSAQASTELNLDIRNSTFSGNTINTSSTNEGTTINIHNSTVYKGSLVLVNNTFKNNAINASTHRSVKVNNVKFDVTVINNVFQDAYDNAGIPVGYSLVIQGGTGNIQGNFVSVTGRGNIGDKIGGSLFTTIWSGFDWGTDPLHKNLKEKYSADVKLSASTTNNANGIPYYTYDDGSILNQGGVNTYTLNSTEIVPTLGINDQVMQTTKDVGNYEKYEVLSSIKPIANIKNVRFSPNPFVDNITIEGCKVANFSIIDMSGKVCFQGKNVQLISTSTLNAGNYLLKVISNEGETIIKKLIKK